MADDNKCVFCGAWGYKDGKECRWCRGTGRHNVDYPIYYSSAAIETAKLRKELERRWK